MTKPDFEAFILRVSNLLKSKATHANIVPDDVQSLIPILTYQSVAMMMLRNLVYRYAAGDSELSDYIRQCFFEMDLDFLLEELSISREDER